MLPNRTTPTASAREVAPLLLEIGFSHAPVIRRNTQAEGQRLLACAPELLNQESVKRTAFTVMRRNLNLAAQKRLEKNLARAVPVQETNEVAEPEPRFVQMVFEAELRDIGIEQPQAVGPAHHERILAGGEAIPTLATKLQDPLVLLYPGSVRFEQLAPYESACRGRLPDVPDVPRAGDHLVTGVLDGEVRKVRPNPAGGPEPVGEDQFSSETSHVAARRDEP